MIDSVLIAFAVAWLRGGRISGWGRFDLKGTEWLFGGFILQYGTVYLALQEIPFFVRYGTYLFVGSFLPILYGAWVSRRLPGMPLIGIGVLLNLIVIAVNGGSMPVDLRAAEVAGLTRAAEELARPEYIKHSAAHAGTKLLFLADIIPIPRPYPRPAVASIGDVVMAAGIFILVQQAMVMRRPGQGRRRGRSRSLV